MGKNKEATKGRDWMGRFLPPPATGILPESLSGLGDDSRTLTQGALFILRCGSTYEESHLREAVQKGAALLLVPEIHLPSVSRKLGEWGAPIPVCSVPDIQEATGIIASAWWDFPSRNLLIVGVTGTNGKTTSSFLTREILETAGKRTGLIGTVWFDLGEGLVEAPQTTPGALFLQESFARARDNGLAAISMEVSSHALDQERVAGTFFSAVHFTNLTRDHLDYHGDMESYAAAKRRFLHWPTLSHAVLNLDDEFGRRTAAELVHRGLRVTGFGTREEHVVMHGLAASLCAEDVTHHGAGLRFRIRCRHTEPGKAATQEDAVVTTALVGDFNVANLLGVAGVLLACELPLAFAAEALSGLRPPPGRMQFVDAGDAAPLVVVDYAHTPDAIAKALQALRPLAQVRSGRLRIVFGAGGDRDRGKRPLMGAAASRGADAVILTSDNPRGEDPGRILDEIAAGIAPGTPLSREADRAAAIEAAIRGAQPCDVILIAGKGHEDYQEIGGRRVPFSDLETADAVLAAIGGRSR